MTQLNARLSKLLMVGALLGVALTAVPAPAEAWWRGGGGFGFHGPAVGWHGGFGWRPGYTWGWRGGAWGWGPAIVGGALVGAAVAGAYAAPYPYPYYYAPPYYAPPPGYAPAPGYAPPAYAPPR